MASRAEAGIASARLPDEEDRQAIVEDLDSNILVEAAAGTGKTTCLVSRMVALIREGKASVDRLSAVTFTIKAAAHLREKFQTELEGAAARETDPERRRRLEEALRNLSACFIGTIHAFCARLLRERPVEAGVDPGFTEMDEPENIAARRQAWERYGERLSIEESPLLPRMTELGVSLENLRETYERISDNSDVVAAATDLPRTVLAAEREAARKFLERARVEIPETIPEGGWDKFAGPLREALRLESILDLRREPDVVAVLEALERAKKPKHTLWPRPSRVLELWRACQTLQTEIVEPALRRWREYLHPILIGAIVPAVAEFAQWRRRQGRLNFQDLLLLARDLLKKHRDVRRACRERFTPILVDEFQDTDPVQAEVILHLTGEETSETNWRKLTPTPGSLFVVGDPKQSIYRFRRADIATYNRVRERIEETGGRILRLTTNFRSAGRICGWANEVFSELFPEKPSPEQAAHVPLAAHRPAGGPEAGVFRLDIVADGQTKDSEVARQDAERVADCVRAAVEEKTRRLAPADFLILLRYRKNMPLYARALEARAIPYEVAGGGAFRDSSEIKTLLPFLQALADPDNPVPLVAALRGPLFGVADSALYRFRRNGGGFSFRSAPPEGTDPGIVRAYQIFLEAERLADSLPPGAAIARICERLGWTAHAASEKLGETRAGNLLKALTAARKLSGQGEDFAGVVGQLTAMTEEGETEEMSTSPGRRDAVQLMTLHRAKGLEARVVFLADPTREKEHDVTEWIARDSDPPRGHFLVRRSAGERGFVEIARPLDWDGKAGREGAFEQAEKDRLLYVAATRAKETLIVSVKRQKNADGTIKIKGPWCKFDRWLQETLPEPLPAGAGEPPLPLGDVGKSLAAFPERRAARLSISSTPSFSVTQVTTVAHLLPLPMGEGRGEGGTIATLPFHERTGRGMSWGRVLHRLLEALMKDPSLDIRAYAANLLAEEDRPTEDLEETIRLVEGVRSSDLWQRALAAKRRLVEVPFALMASSADLGLTAGPSETLLQGAIDLVFQEDSGWIVVDYKSDTISGNLDQLVRFYRPQLAHYRRYWEDLTGQPTKAGLFFIQTGEQAWLEQEDT